MKKILFIMMIYCFVCSPLKAEATTKPQSPSQARHESILDLEREVLAIPDTHEDSELYKWEVKRNPKEYISSLEETNQGEFLLKIKSRKDRGGIEGVRVFVTNAGLDYFAHIEPTQLAPDKFQFDYAVPEKGIYYFEIVFKDQGSWVNVQKKIRVESLPVTQQQKNLAEQGYDILIKSVPAKAYAEHITTFLYEFSFNGQSVRDLQRINDSDIFLVSWAPSRFGGALKDFNFAVSRQNLGGPEAAISLVLKKGGRHVVFTTFRHRGEEKTIRHEINVNLENNIKIPFSF